MKKFLRICWLAFCILLAVVYLLSACSHFIPPSAFSYMVFIALLFPYLFIAVLIAALLSLWRNKKLAVILFLLLIPGLYNLCYVVAVSPAATWKNAKDTASLRIMTWNVSDFINAYPLSSPLGTDRKQMLQLITDYQPDVMCLQEYSDVTHSRDQASVAHELDSIGFKYSYVSKELITATFYGLVVKGAAIYSKTPLLDSGHVLINDGWHPESMIYADVLFHNKPVRLHTAHLFSFYLFPDSARGYNGERTVFKKLYYYRKDIKSRMQDIEVLHQKEAAIIRNRLDKSPYPSVYCGDMNAPPTSYTYYSLKGNMQDAFLAKGNGIGATFYNIVPTLRIDICLADKHFAVQQCTVAAKKLSDHYPVITDVSWKQP